MTLEARCRTTAMGIMPHTDIEAALELALSLDIPFWPQLPKVSYYEDMYAQTSQNFPGIAVDVENKRVSFNTAKFEQELGDYFEKMNNNETFTLSPEYSAVYHKFLSKELSCYHAIRGQITGPVSFGFNVIDENRKPIIYNDEVRTILFDFIQKKVNVQYHELSEKNPNVFVWVDEPGLGYVFSGLSGYTDRQAKEDYQTFLQGLEGPKGLHLCANVNLPYLLELGFEILSFDAYQLEFMPREYTSAVADFLKNGGVISWGIVPTESTILSKETPETLARRLTNYWEVISQDTNLPLKQIAEQALVAPARCCLRDIGQENTSGDAPKPSESACQLTSIEEKIVEKSFAYIREISKILKGKYGA